LAASVGVERAVGFVADGAHERRVAVGGRAHDAFVAEAQQVLEVAATARHDDDLDLGVGVERADGCRDVGDGALTLHGGVHHAESHGGPAQLGVAQDVFFGIRVFARDEADATGKEGERFLARHVEEPLGFQLRAQAFEAFEQVAQADVFHVEDLHGERAALDPVVGFDHGDHVIALLQVGRDA
jgi:hypothetical protein